MSDTGIVPQPDSSSAPMSIEQAVDAMRERMGSADDNLAPTPDEAHEEDGQPEPSNPVEDSGDGEAFEDDSTEEEVTADADDVEPDAEEEAEDEDAADDEEEAQSEDEAAKHRLRIGDEELEVTTDELKAGYIRQRDYTQKAQALAERRREIDETSQQVEADRRTYREKATAYDQLIGQLSGVVDAEGKQFESVDWAKLKADDLSEYLIKRDEYREHQERKQAVERERVRLAREAEAEARKEEQKARDALQKALFSADFFPHWADESKAKAEVQDMEAAAVELGFSKNELAQTLDPRAWKLLWEAAQYRKLTSQKPAAKSGTKQKPEASKPPATRVLKANAARPAPVTGNSAQRKAEARLRSNKPIGSIDEAFDLYKAVRKGRAA